MSNRTFFWSRCLVLAGALMAAPGYAKSPLQWKSPQSDNTAQTNNTPSISNPTQPPIQLVRFDRQQGFMEDDFDPANGFGTGIAAPTPSGNTLGGSSTLGSMNGIGRTGLVQGGKVVIHCPEDNILKPIRGIDHDIRPKPGSLLPEECGLGGDDYFPSRDFEQICFMWKASALCHKPLYFEEEALERYGHTLVKEEFQPIISGAKFFLTVPILPYKMGINPPCECIYTLGHYRPGSCAPYMMDPLPLSVRAGLIQAGVVVGGVAIFP